MNELESVDEPGEAAAVVQPAPANERASVGVDLAARPESAWLDDVEGEIDDVDMVLKCLARDSAKMCQACDGLQSAGELAERPVLARCASGKQAR